MSELDNNLKEKSKRRGRTSPLDFVVPLQLEACVHRIKQISDEEPFHFTIERTDDADKVKFRLSTGEALKTSINASGTLKRWEGTSTRFEGEVKIYNPLSFLEQFFLLIVFPFLLVLSGFTVYIIMLTLLPSLRNMPWNNPLFYAFIGAPPGLWLVVKRANYRRMVELQNRLKDVLVKDNKEL